MSAQAPDITTKASIRQHIWDYIEKNNLANFPRPVHNRIPNFKGANAAGERVVAMEIFKRAKTIKVNPDKPQEWVRYQVLHEGKMLLVPTPRLKSGLFNRILPPTGANTAMLKKCATREGITNYSAPVGLEHKINIDLIVIGSVAVSSKGYRIGKGEGYADMEYAMLVTMGAVNQDTVMVSTVHDCQVVDIPDELIDVHDLMVDYIVTPTRIIQCQGHKQSPVGIQWSKVTPQMLKDIPVLKDLREKERRVGKNVTLNE
ncbi:LOW QUALITY PROTEIN: methenyltetrahydrofolate synthase domain-containing protein-like [Stylophora pistillata]|uniref:LOW QUALITY PROTEIN: methenyltetrahydrofolate synthase domain-containing protein-like n=1 Tax=Stylophora pistillata TaxID=50429 RepID=UPI000C0509FA|nr:LOW QUALITY PROTEIN: methenyltetrahydrofolate synthase domain-containing protein-like [Stylophora pistillata]